MKILAIRMRNLASIDGLAEIDFTREPLCSAGIFAITGATGAGKSTILDALCLALYAQTPRYKNAEGRIELRDVANSMIGQNDVRGILRDGTGEGFAEVDFVGVDGKKYRAQWKVNRARNKATGAIQKESLMLKALDNDQVIASLKSEACREIERLVGLNYEQFTRSVLLAQGDFTAFLKADKDAKASLLEKLTGTDIYSRISQQVYFNYKKASEVVDRLQSQLGNVQLLSEEELKRYTETTHSLNNKIQELELELVRISQGLQWHQQLSDLHASQTRLQLEVESASSNLHQAAPRQDYLFLVEQVQKIRPAMEKLQETDIRISNNNRLLDEHQLNAERAANASQRLVKEIESTVAQHLKATMERQAAGPFLTRASQLDSLIQEKAGQFSAASKESLLAKQTYDAVLEQRSKKQVQHAALLSTINVLEEWQKKNADRKLLAENSALVISKLEDAQRTVLHVDSKAIETASQQSNIREQQDKLLVLEQTSGTILETLGNLKQESLDAQTQLAVLDMDLLEEQRDACDKLMQEIASASVTWTALYAELQTRDLHRDKIVSLKESLQEKTKRLSEVETAIPVAEENKRLSQKRLDKTRLELAKDVEHLRKLLTDGESCPVCGSTDHPYTKHMPVFKNTLTALEQEAEENELGWQQLTNERASLTSFLQSTEKEIQGIEHGMDQACKKINDLQSTWKGYTLYKNCESLELEDISNWLNTCTQQKKLEQHTITENIRQHHRLRTVIDGLENNRKKLEKEALQLQHSMDLARQIITNSEHIILRLKHEQEDLQSSLGTIINELNVYFTNPNWQQHWKDQPGEFSAQIRKFEVDWKTNLSTLESKRLEQGTTNSELEHLQLQLGNCEKDLNTKTNLAAIIEKDLQQKKLDRANLFSGRPVSEVESELDGSITILQDALNTQTRAKQELDIKISAINSAIGHLSQAIEKDNQLANSCNDQIRHWLSEFNDAHARALSRNQLVELIQHDAQWIDEERIFFQQLREKLLQAQAGKSELERQIEQHASRKNSDKSQDELNDLRTEYTTLLDSIKQELTEIRLTLKQDKDNNQKAGAFKVQLLEQSSIAENWARLNEMIGSADGKKFRQVAQEYTLEVLLGFANVHLKALTRRYELQRIPDTLGLQVVDHDMGDEIRTVYSLSGGESFLVSLALALGLASLSSNNIKVESLFIDEGFGSLDPATLNIAMDALERLHNQGRKVGVISHVQEMKERIMTQIKVTKQSSGKSIITIENGLD